LTRLVAILGYARKESRDDVLRRTLVTALSVSLAAGVSCPSESARSEADTDTPVDPMNYWCRHSGGEEDPCSFALGGR
jgi:hypothetical protein